MESCECPITNELFEDPVMGSDGHTYEREAITNWLRKHGTSPLTGETMNINSLRTNYMAKKVVEELKSKQQMFSNQFQFKLDVDIKKTRQRPVFQAFGKSIYEVEWINHKGPPIVLLKIDGAKANREASFYSRLSSHPHVIRTFGFVESKPDSVSLVQEYAPQGDLSELLREHGFKPTETVLCQIFQQICDALIYLAHNDIVHGDLACRNVLVFQSNPNDPKKNLVKLTDFGLTRTSSLFSIVPTPSKTIMSIIPIRYAAPEILRDQKNLQYSEKSDIYSMAVLMWEACSYGELPYSSIDDDDVQQKKLNDERLLRPSLCGKQLWTFINQCWNINPEERPSFKELQQSLLTLEFSNVPNSIVLNTDVPLETKDNIEPEPIFTYDCGQKYMSEAALQEHQQDNCVNRLIECSFCHEMYPATDLGEHLMLCGNKTEQCPNCRKYVRRAIFNYHFENNCAWLDDENIQLNVLKNDKLVYDNSSMIDEEFLPKTTTNTVNSFIPNVEPPFSNRTPFKKQNAKFKQQQQRTNSNFNYISSQNQQNTNPYQQEQRKNSNFNYISPQNQQNTNPYQQEQRTNSNFNYISSQNQQNTNPYQQEQRTNSNFNYISPQNQQNTNPYQELPTRPIPPTNISPLNQQNVSSYRRRQNSASSSKNPIQINQQNTSSSQAQPSKTDLRNSNIRSKEQNAPRSQQLPIKIPLPTYATQSNQQNPFFYETPQTSPFEASNTPRFNQQHPSLYEPPQTSSFEPTNIAQLNQQNPFLYQQPDKNQANSFDFPPPQQYFNEPTTNSPSNRSQRRNRLSGDGESIISSSKLAQSQLEPNDSSNNMTKNASSCQQQ